jgi:hypothetical protein
VTARRRARAAQGRDARPKTKKKFAGAFKSKEKLAPSPARRPGPEGAHAPAHSRDTEHGHTHSHDAPHAHRHAHAHDDAPPHRRARPAPEELHRLAEHAQAHRPALPPLAGAGKLLYLDAASGVAGDMTIAALVDLGVPLEAVERAVAALPLEGVALHLRAGHAGAIGATRFDVLVDGPQPERRYAEIDAMLATAPLEPAVATLARAIFRRLGEAEAEVHRIALAEVHFHEVGAVDAIVDVVGAAACFVYLGAEVVSSPLPLGRGFVSCRHGVLPLPAPAAAVALAGVPTYAAGIEGELVTPTGAAIVATVAKRFQQWPSMVPEKMGWGAGTSVLPDRPNALRVVLGSVRERASEDEATHVVIEANVDDMTGEAAGHAIAALLAGGALDAWACPIVMKKGRPGLVVSALARKMDAERVAGLLLRETPSIGVRFVPARRLERPRVMHTVTTRFGDIPVKVSGGPYGAPVIKPEFDACVRAAEHAGVPVRVVLEEALALARTLPAP